MQWHLGPNHGYDATGRGGEIITVLLDEPPVSHGDLTMVTGWSGR